VRSAGTDVPFVGPEEVRVDWLPITYRGFWDVPRSFVVVVDGVGHLLWSEFRDDRDEYSDRYRVVVLDPDALPDPPASVWMDPASGGREVGAVPVAGVVFDPTRRRAVDARLRTALAALPR
jgi:hypothetical protein